MTEYQIEIASIAEGDIREAFVWYRDRNARAAQDFRLEVFSAVERIAQGPLIRAADENGERHAQADIAAIPVYRDVRGESAHRHHPRGRAPAASARVLAQH